MNDSYNFISQGKKWMNDMWCHVFFNEFGNYIRLCFERTLEKNPFIIIFLKDHFYVHVYNVCYLHVYKLNHYDIKRIFPEKIYLLSAHFYTYFKFMTSSDNFVNMAVFRGDPCGIICLVITYMSLFYADYVVVRHLIIPSMSNT